MPVKYHFLTGSCAEREQPGVCRVTFDPEVGFTLETAGTGYANPSFVLPRAYRLNRVTLCLEGHRHGPGNRLSGMPLPT